MKLVAWVALCFLPVSTLYAAEPATRTASQPTTRTVEKPPAAEARFDIKFRKPDDTVRVHVDGRKTYIDIRSAGGIGGAALTRNDPSWPETVVLRVHLRGLESFNITCGGVTLRVSVLSHSGNPRLLHLQREGQPEGPELAKDDPNGTDVRVMDADGRALDGGLPPNGGWFELAVPKAVLGNEGKTITLDWIDFYRG